MKNIEIPKMRFSEFNKKWKEVRLGKISLSFSGGTPDTKVRKFYEGNIPFIKSGEISFETTTQFISKEGIEKSSAKYVKKGDLLYALYGATSGEVAISKIDGAINQAVLCIRSNELNNKYLAALLRKKKRDIVGKYIQGGQGNLSAEIIKSLRIFIPDTEEQSKIADFFTTLDDRIQTQQSIVENLEKLKKGYMQKIFSQELRFKDENGEDFPEWEEKRLGQICTIKTGKCDANEMSENGQYKFFTCSKKDYLIGKFSFEGESLIIAGNGDVGHVKYYDGKFDAYQRTYILQSFKHNAKLLMYYLSIYLPKTINSELNIGAMPFIRLSTLQQQKILLPCYSEQMAIVDFLQALDCKINTEEQILSQFKKLKTGYLQQMFI